MKDHTIAVEDFVNGLRKLGINVSASEIIQDFLESADTYFVNDGNKIQVYQRGTDDLLMVMRNEE